MLTSSRRAMLQRASSVSRSRLSPRFRSVAGMQEQASRVRACPQVSGQRKVCFHSSLNNNVVCGSLAVRIAAVAESRITDVQRATRNKS